MNIKDYTKMVANQKSVEMVSDRRYSLKVNDIMKLKA